MNPIVGGGPRGREPSFTGAVGSIPIMGPPEGPAVGYTALRGLPKLVTPPFPTADVAAGGPAKAVGSIMTGGGPAFVGVNEAENDGTGCAVKLVVEAANDGMEPGGTKLDGGGGMGEG